MQRSSLTSSWALIALAGLVACEREPPPPVAGLGGIYQPATLAEAVLLRNGTASKFFGARRRPQRTGSPTARRPLMRAVHGQIPAIAQLLIDAGADVKKANYYGVTALYIAARAGDPSRPVCCSPPGADANAALLRPARRC